MDPGPLRDVLTVIAGVVTGIMSGAFGVGGAVVSTPAIRLLGASAFIAVGSTIPSVLPSALTGTWHYAQEKLIEWRVVAWTAPAGIVAAVGGSLLSQVVPGEGHVLMLMTAALLAITAVRMARPSLRATEVVPRDQRNDGPLVLGAIGASAGLLSGLLGVGGGVILVPAFAEVARIPLKSAIGTSLACVGLFALPSTITHAALGDIDWSFAIWLTIGVIPGARIGSTLAIKASDRRLRRSVAWFLGVIAAVYAAGEVIALFD